MSTLHLPNNIKVHFAGLEGRRFISSVSEMGIQYGLYTAFPYVYKKLFGKSSVVVDCDADVPYVLSRKMKHVIQDSGLFSLLYGKSGHLATKEIVYKWYDALVEFTLEHGQDVSVVEVDCQDILGTEIAWDLRTRMRDDLPEHRIINVFHFSDGMEGLDRLIEFSDYIGVGSGTPENSSYSMYEVSSYIKRKKPECDIHLLGCTNLNTIRKCNFCTSCDSISWKSPMRFGVIDDYHISDLDTDKVKTLVGERIWNTIALHGKEQSVNAYIMSIEQNKRLYEKFAGNQDYTRRF